MGPSVTSQTPLVPFFISAPWPLPGMSLPLSRTASALGARMRKVTRRSAETSGETTWGPCGPRPRCGAGCAEVDNRSEEHTSELQSQSNLVCRLLLEKKKNHEDAKIEAFLPREPQRSR